MTGRGDPSAPAAVPPGAAIPATTRVRVFSGMRAALGAVHVLWPGLAAAPLVRGPVDSRARVVLRILGVRQLVQAAVTGARPTPAVLAVGAGVDATHAVSMVAFGLGARRWRRAALVSAAVAALFSVLQAAECRRVDAAGWPDGARQPVL